MGLTLLRAQASQGRNFTTLFTAREQLRFTHGEARRKHRKRRGGARPNQPARKDARGRRRLDSLQLQRTSTSAGGHRPIREQRAADATGASRASRVARGSPRAVLRAEGVLHVFVRAAVAM